jgi:hypothetical protein
MRTLDYNNADAHRLPILNKKNMINQTTTSLEKAMSDTPITDKLMSKAISVKRFSPEMLVVGAGYVLSEIPKLEHELSEAKEEAKKWEKLYDQDTDHLLSLQKRDNYGPTETLNETAMRLSRELTEAQTTLQFAKKEYHALFREFSILVKQRDTLAKICAGIEQAYLEGSDSEWGNALMDIRLALAAMKGYEA